MKPLRKALLSLLAGLGVWPALGPGDALRIGSDLQLFVDDYHMMRDADLYSLQIRD